jgi:hypothetical protein
MSLYIHDDDNSFCWLLTVLTTLFRNTLNWKQESLNICLQVHLFLILFCCCLSVSFEIMQTTHQMLALLPFIFQVSCWILDQTLVIPPECFLIFHIPSRQILAYFYNRLNHFQLHSSSSFTVSFILMMFLLFVWVISKLSILVLKFSVVYLHWGIF